MPGSVVRGLGLVGWSPPLPKHEKNQKMRKMKKIRGLFVRAPAASKTAGVSQSDLRKPKRALWEGHGLEPRPRLHENTQREKKGRRLWRGREKKKKLEISGGPAEGQSSGTRSSASQSGGGGVWRRAGPAKLFLQQKKCLTEGKMGK